MNGETSWGWCFTNGEAQKSQGVKENSGDSSGVKWKESLTKGRVQAENKGGIGRGQIKAELERPLGGMLTHQDVWIRISELGRTPGNSALGGGRWGGVTALNTL